MRPTPTRRPRRHRWRRRRRHPSTTRRATAPSARRRLRRLASAIGKGFSVTICHSERLVSGRGGAGRATVRAMPLAAAGQARLRRAGGDGAITSPSHHDCLMSLSHRVLHARSPPRRRVIPSRHPIVSSHRAIWSRRHAITRSRRLARAAATTSSSWPPRPRASRCCPATRCVWTYRDHF